MLMGSTPTAGPFHLVPPASGNEEEVVTQVQVAPRKKKRGPAAFTAANAPAGHPKQLFVDDPANGDRMICIICREQFPNEPDRASVSIQRGKGSTNAETHLWRT